MLQNAVWSMLQNDVWRRGFEGLALDPVFHRLIDVLDGHARGLQGRPALRLPVQGVVVDTRAARPPGAGACG
jgi:hypothetical protein